MRAISIAVIATAIVIAGLQFLGGGRWLTRGDEAARIEVRVLDQDRFYVQTLEQIGAKHSEAVFSPVPDASLSAWLSGFSSVAGGGGNLNTRDILDQLGSDLPQVSSATACVAYAGSIESLSRSIAEWATQVGPSFNQFATHVFADASSQQVGCAAVAVKRLDSFDPDKINNGGERSFTSACRLCGRSHISTIEHNYGAAALTCPHCHSAYDLLAFKVGGKVCHANELLTGWAPPVRLPHATSRVHEMVLIWKAVLDRIRYAKDLQGLHRNLDTWQLADETWRYKNGDCEDSSILLTDWLIERGFDARVVIGTTDKLEGHAWVVVNLEGTTYLLETTGATPDVRNLPYAASRSRYYRPSFQFNRHSIFFRRDESPKPRYWSTNAWLQVDAVEKPSL